MYLNSSGVLLKTWYSPLYHTFNLIHRLDNNSYAIQRGGSSTPYFWSISKTAVISPTSTTYMVGQPFLLESVTPVATQQIKVRKCAVYPTTVSTVLNVNLPDESKTAELILYSCSGTRLGSWALKSGLNTLDMTGLPQGLIIGQIRSNTFRESVKFIKATY